jgi:mRNA-degrading endonuclease toxin of MazEF toxin-antitoxin module
LSSRFKQGDIIWFDFPEENEPPQYTIKNSHPALILHDSSLPNQTVILCPITSLYDDAGNKKDLKSYHLPLYKKDYPRLDKDSYAKLDQIMTFSRNKIKSPCIGHLNDVDKASLHLKLIETLQMEDTIQEFVQIQTDLKIQKMMDEYQKMMEQNS